MKDQPPKIFNKNKTIVADRCKAPTKAARENKISLNALTRNGYPGTPLAVNDLPCLLSVGFWDVPANQQWGLETHTNEGIELTFLETGKLVFNLKKTHILKPGHMTITRPWQPHALGDPNITPGRLHWIILDVGVRKPHQKWHWPEWLVLTPADLKELTILLRQNETPVWSAGDEIATCFKKIAELTQNPKSSLRISRLTILINELFISLYEMLKNRPVKLEPELITSYRTVELFLESLKENNELLLQEWTINTMADHCHLGVTHFTHLCKTLSNMTPMQYLNSQRIEIAAKLLIDKPKRSITDIAFDCGFESSQYFATVFKKYHKCTPRAYRKEF